MVNTWRRRDRADSENVHVLPVDDLREHVETAQCWCNPKCSKVETFAGGWGYVIVHNSADGRELAEPGRVQ